MTTHEEYGKEVFAVWSRTYAGSSTTMSFDYSHRSFHCARRRRAISICLRAASGATGDYNFEIDAPLGYVFAENHLASFTYESTSTPGRMIFNLTLQKL